MKGASCSQTTCGSADFLFYNGDAKTMTPPEISPPSPAPYRDRKVWLVLFGVATVIAGLVCALFVPLVLWSQTMAAKQGNVAAPAAPLFLAATTYGFLAIMLVWLGIGSIMARRWARALLLIWSWIWLFGGIIGFIAVAATLQSTLAKTAAAHAASGKAAPVGIIYAVTLCILAFFAVVLPLIWMLFYRGENVRATCEARDPVVRWTDRCPLPVLGLVLWLGFSAAMCLLVPFWSFQVVPFFGVFLSGAAGVAAFLVMAVVWLYAARALYRLELRGWWIALAATCFYSFSSVITFSRHGLGEMYALMHYPPEMIAQITSSPMMRSGWILWGPLVFLGIFVGYLVYIRKFFAASA